MSDDRQRPWDAYVSPLDQEVFAAAGYGKQLGLGTRPALFLIDLHYNFVGEQPMPILEAVKEYRTSCGERGWDAIARTVPLLEMFRRKGWSVAYTVSERRADMLDSGIQTGKSYRGHERSAEQNTRATEIVAPLKPMPQDLLISKRKPSAFFGTPLMSHLNFLDIDTLVIVGCTTSGCVRSTAVDAYAYNFKTVVVEDCVFDRFESSHAMALFDLNAKYANVTRAEDLMRDLETLPARAEG
jgi:nicotinamidase-related amidase